MSPAEDQQAREEEGVKAPSKARLIVFYLVLSALVVAGVTVSISAGDKKKAEKSIAGGYDVLTPNPCIGQKFDLNQSGEFANLDNMDQTLGGQLRVKKAHVTGDVDCIKGPRQKLDARVT